MPTTPLYLLLLCSVLCLTGCETDVSQEEAAPSDAAAPATTDSATAASATAPADSALQVLILGNSITAGYGVEDEEAFPARLQQRVDSLGWDVNIRGAGVSGETTAGGLRRISWLLRRPVDVLVIELGGNDGLRGVNPESSQENLQAIIDSTRARYPESRIILGGMQIPPNMGEQYTRAFRQIYPTLAERNEIELIPFVLEGVGGVDSLNLDDGIHPNPAGHRIVAQNVWTVLRPVLEELRQREAVS